MSHNPLVSAMKYFGLPVTREAYARLASLGERVEIDPETDCELPVFEDDIRAHGMGVALRESPASRQL